MNTKTEHGLTLTFQKVTFENEITEFNNKSNFGIRYFGDRSPKTTSHPLDIQLHRRTKCHNHDGFTYLYNI